MNFQDKDKFHAIFKDLPKEKDALKKRLLVHGDGENWAEYGLPDAPTYDNVAEFLYYEFLNMCGCGDPEDCSKWWRDALLTILFYGMTDLEWDTREAFGQTVLGKHDGAKWAIYHMFENYELTEHGGCAPGWLTFVGETVLLALIDEHGMDDVPFPEFDKEKHKDQWDKCIQSLIDRGYSERVWDTCWDR